MRFAVFGAGYVGKLVIDCIGEEHVDFFIDNHRSDEFFGKPVYTLEYYKSLKIKPRLIIATFDYVSEIIGQLISNDISSFYIWTRELEERFNNSTDFPAYFQDQRWLPYSPWRSFLNSDFEKYNKFIVYCDRNNCWFYYEMLRCVGKSCDFIFYNSNERFNYNCLCTGDTCLIVAVNRKDNRICELYEDMATENIIDLYQIISYIPELHCPEIKKYKDKYKGKRCFLIGNGPSLRMSDLNVLKEHKEISFGCNKIYLAFDKTEWRPDFYCISDSAAFLSIPWDELDLQTVKIIASKLKTKTCVHDNETYWFHYREEMFGQNSPRFSNDISVCMYTGYTVLYDVMLQSALYMGFSEIYLLGVDQDYSRTLGRLVGDGEQMIMTCDEDHFVKGYLKPGDRFNMPCTEAANRAFIKAKKEAVNRGVQIYNATRGGKLEVFERMNFDCLFEVAR